MRAQCDQIWRNFATWQNSACLIKLKKNKLVFGNFSNCFGILLRYWPNFHCYQWRNIEKESNHLVTLVETQKHCFIISLSVSSLQLLFSYCNKKYLVNKMEYQTRVSYFKIVFRKLFDNSLTKSSSIVTKCFD